MTVPTPPATTTPTPTFAPRKLVLRDGVWLRPTADPAVWLGACADGTTRPVPSWFVDVFLAEPPPVAPLEIPDTTADDGTEPLQQEAP